jgi:hypothetical protein
MSKLSPTGPQWLVRRLVLSHSLMQQERCGWQRNSEHTFEFSIQKYISETDIFPHGTKSLLASVILPSYHTFVVHSGANLWILNIIKRFFPVYLWIQSSLFSVVTGKSPICYHSSYSQDSEHLTPQSQIYVLLIRVYSRLYFVFLCTSQGINKWCNENRIFKVVKTKESQIHQSVERNTRLSINDLIFESTQESVCCI